MTAPARSTSMDPGLEAPIRRNSKAKDEATLDMFGAAPALVTHVVEVRAHLRQVAGAKPASGAERRDAALERMSEKDAVRAALDYVRPKLVELYKSRVRWMHASKHWISSDDADRLFREWPHYPRELLEGSNNWRGSLFAQRGWQKTGERIQSTRERLHATELPCWKWVGE